MKNSIPIVDEVRPIIVAREIFHKPCGKKVIIARRTKGENRQCASSPLIN